MQVDDPEIGAMSVISSALDDLEADTQARILEWAAKRYDVPLLGSNQQRKETNAGGSTGSESNAGSSGTAAYGDFVDLFDASGAKTEAQRALVAGYWFQEIQGIPSFQAQQVNNALKDLGQGVSNITEALGALESRKPAEVRQMGKSGRTRQARKTYKLTAAGINAVKAMVESRSGDDEE